MMDGWLLLERWTLVLLACGTALAVLIGWRRSSRAAVVVAGAGAAAFFCVWMVGPRVLVPTETDWVFKLDWQTHFLAWHFFRHEPLHLPPGRMDGYYTPMGTAIGLIDAIPLAAFVLRPFASVLPMPLQYLGGWVLLSFALQGTFGVLLTRFWTSNVLAQVLGASCFVLLPSLIVRVPHAALTAHWLMLWALYLYLRTDRARPPSIVHIATLGLVCGLINPYLTAMVLPLLAAVGVRASLPDRGSPARGIAVLVASTGAAVAGWWASGFFLVSGLNTLTASGLRHYSMNLLGPVTPSGRSRLLPEIAIANPDQGFEGFQYLGAGVLLLFGVAAVARLARRTPTSVQVLWPLALVCIGLAVYALSPRVTLGGSTLIELPVTWLDRAAFFRVPARFFWPLAYLGIALSLATLLLRLPPRLAVPLLAGLVILQVVDLGPGYARQRAARLEPSFFVPPNVLASPAWHAALSEVDHVVLYPPPHCGPSPVPFGEIAYLSGLQGRTLNAGALSRHDDVERLRSCQRLLQQVRGGGPLDARTLYVAEPVYEQELLAAGGGTFGCRQADGAVLCAETDGR